MKTKNIVVIILIVIIGISALYILFFHNSKDNLVKIGISLPLNYESYGVDPLNGVKLALLEINNRIDDKTIELIIRDDEANPNKGSSIMNEFAVMKLAIIIGSAASNVSLAMTPIANRNHIVLFSPISSADTLTQTGGDYFYRNVSSDSYQSKIIAEMILKNKPKTVGILFVDNSWGRGLMDAAVNNLEKNMVTVVKEKVSSDNVTDFSTQITNFKRMKVESVFMPLYPRSAGLAVKQCREYGITVPIFGADSWGSQEFLDGAGVYAEGAMFVVPGISSGREFEEFSQKYQKEYKRVPNFNAASAYDCMKIIEMVIKEILSDNREITGENIKNLLNKIEYKGVSGVTKFDKYGDVIGKDYTKKIIKNGTFDFLTE